MEQRAPTREENAAAFADDGVVAAYRFRPPYPEALIERLLALVPGGVRMVLELGCGTGELSRKLARHVEHVDAVDPSVAMLRTAQAADGGDAANIRWTHAFAEQFDYPRTYDLAVAAESIHWMDWDVVFPRLAGAMSPSGRFVWVTRNEDTAWADDYRTLAERFSVNTDFHPVDFPAELERLGHWRMEGRDTTPPVRFRQPVDDYVELQHSRSSFARYRIGAANAAEFDRDLRSILEPHAHDGTVEYEFSAPYAWGRPLAR